MKKLSVFVMISASAMLFLTCCGGGGTKESSTTTEPQAVQEEVEQSSAMDLAAQLARGEQIYKEKCIVCHQADAKGIKGAFPPLAGADYLLADPIRGVIQTLNGSNEEMIINGEKYHAPMVPQVTSKEDAVAVINYVLKHFNGYTDDQLLTLDDAKDVEIKPMQVTQQ